MQEAENERNHDSSNEDEPSPRFPALTNEYNRGTQTYEAELKQNAS